jgi:MGT family glycosyltransferase
MINLPFAGHTNPTLPLTKALVQRGHKVSYINAEEFRGRIEDTGANFVPFRDFPVSPTVSQNKLRCFRAAFDTAMGMEQKFDLLIYEVFFYPGIKVAENLGIPCVRQYSQPAWNQQTFAAATWRFKLSCEVIDLQVMGKRNTGYMGLGHKSLRDALVNDMPQLNVVYVPQEFQPDRDSFGDDYLFAVPMVEGIAERMEIPFETMKPPIVYISLGSMISNKGFCKECIRAFGRKKMSVILNTGGIRPETLGKIPANIFAYPYVPQTEVLKNADVFLTHCGMNSVNEAMIYGVPMVAMPFVNDQLENAKRIVSLGIGKRVRTFPSSGWQLYRTVKAVYKDEQMLRKCAALQDQVSKESSLSHIVERIERLLK